MTRREAIRNIAIASAGTVFITSCSEAEAISFLEDNKLSLDNNHLEYLNTISNTFLPREDIGSGVETPGDFIQNMMNECYSPEDLQQYVLGFDQYKSLMKESKLKIKSSDANEIISKVEEILEDEMITEELTLFIKTTKEKAIEHFLTSEKYQTEVYEYKLIPERYDGCIDV